MWQLLNKRNDNVKEKKKKVFVDGLLDNMDGSGVDFRARKLVLLLARQISKHFLGRGRDKVHHGAQIKDLRGVLQNMYLHILGMSCLCKRFIIEMFDEMKCLCL